MTIDIAYISHKMTKISRFLHLLLLVSPFATCTGQNIIRTFLCCPFITRAQNELSQRLVPYCSVEDATLEGAFAVDDSVVNNVRTLTNYVSKCAEKFAAHAQSVTQQ